MSARDSTFIELSSNLNDMELATDTDAAAQKINIKMLNAGCRMSSVKRLMMGIEYGVNFRIIPA